MLAAAVLQYCHLGFYINVVMALIKTIDWNILHSYITVLRAKYIAKHNKQLS